MKRYLVFSGDAFQPLGGWNDFQRNESDYQEAVRWADSRIEKKEDHWAHVVDIESGRIVYRVGYTLDGEVIP